MSDLSVSRDYVSLADIREILKDNLPEGVRLIAPEEAKKRIAQNGFDPDETYNPIDAIEIEVLDRNALYPLIETVGKVRGIIRKAMPENATLIQMNSECHSVNAHKVFTAASIAAGHGDIFCDEAPADHLGFEAYLLYDLCKEFASIHFKSHVSLAAMETHLQQLKKIDPHGHLYAKAHIINPQRTSEYADNIINDTILKTNMTVANVDAIQDLGMLIHPSDPTLRTIAKDLFGEDFNLETEKLYLRSENPKKDLRGFIGRNYIMASNTMHAAKDHHDILMRTGLRHIGGKYVGVSYDDSLPATTLKEAHKQNITANVLSIYFSFMAHNIDARAETYLKRIDARAETYLQRARMAGHIPLIVHGFNQEKHEPSDELLPKLEQSFKDARQTNHPAYAIFEQPVEIDEAELEQQLRAGLG